MRRAGQAVAGYFPTPARLVPRIAALLSYDWQPARPYGGPPLRALDPCAGDGAAVLGLCEALLPPRDAAGVRAGRAEVELHAVEMEGARHAALLARAERTPWLSYESRHERKLIAGDAFGVEFAPGGAALLYLNPPYDHDPDAAARGRAEQRFLARFAPALAADGVLVFVVPGRALAASADALAAGFTHVAAWRFPAADYAAFKQVVVLARKRGAPLRAPAAAVAAAVRAWGADAAALPELPELPDAAGAPAPRYAIPCLASGFTRFVAKPADLGAVAAAFRPWHASDRAGALAPLPRFLPAVGAGPRRYPVATPVRPTHIAAGAAAGVFDGAALRPDDGGAGGLPDLLVRASFVKRHVVVETKDDKEGELAAVVTVERPRLEVNVLDLASGAFHTLKAAAAPTGAGAVADFGVGDLLAHYGRSLLATLRAHCPVLHDPATAAGAAAAAALPAVGRPLFAAQAHAVAACVRLLGGPAPAAGAPAANRRARRALAAARRGAAAVVLGEIGCGKTAVALATARAIGARRALVLVPPHLLEGWRREAAVVLPGVRVVTLAGPADVDALAAADPREPVVALLSREAAKLGAGVAGVATGRCPACGAPVAAAPAVLARRRARCEARPLAAGNAPARALEALASAMAPAWPALERVAQHARGANAPRLLAAYARRPHPPAAVAGGPDVARVAWRLARAYAAAVDGLYHRDNPGRRLFAALARLLWARDEPALTAAVARWLYVGGSLAKCEGWGPAASVREDARELFALALCGARRAEAAAAGVAEFVAAAEAAEERRYAPAWDRWRADVAKIAAGAAGVRVGALRVGTADDAGDDDEAAAWYRHTGTARPRATLPPGTPPNYHGAAAGDATAALPAVLEALAELAVFVPAPAACGAALFQAVPEPRRVALADYIVARQPRLFDLLVADEVHEYAGDGTAQGNACDRLAQLGMPFLGLTGSVMNGYAASLFRLLWRVSPEFRARYRRDQLGEFVREYGYAKRLIEAKHLDGRPAEYGAVTDRVASKGREAGQAPGVLPLFVLQYLLRYAVTLQQADLEADIPPRREIPVAVAPDAALGREHDRLQGALLEAIKADRFKTGRAGQLLGALVEFTSYPDRATGDVGNVEGGGYEVRYPEALDRELVAAAAPRAAAEVLPKEAWILETVRAELAEGRRVMVLCWHAELAPRLVKLLAAATGEPVARLEAAKVDAGEREAWIRHHVLGEAVAPETPGARKLRGKPTVRRVLVTNPVAIQTGLNCLTEFPTQVFAENPGCNPTTYRQVRGRGHRVGQRLPTRFYFPYYARTAQATAHALLASKVAVASAVDGVSPETALEAAGVGEAVYTEHDLGAALYRLLAAEQASGGAGPHAAPPAATAADLVAAAVARGRPAAGAPRRPRKGAAGAAALGGGVASLPQGSDDTLGSAE